MGNEIKISPQHGVNPSMSQCFFCLRTKGVLLLGRLPGDERAPHQLCADRDPCDTCADFMERGCILVSARASSVDKANPYRTGGWVVITDEGVEKLPVSADMKCSILESRFAFIDDEAWNMCGLPHYNNEHDN